MDGRINSAALSGMRAAQTRLSSAANNIANAQTDGYRREQVRSEAEPALGAGVRTRIDKRPEPGADLAADMVEQKMAATSFAANLQVFKAADQAMGRLLDTRA